MWPGLHVAWGDPGPYGKGEGSEGCDLGLGFNRNDCTNEEISMFNTLTAVNVLNTECSKIVWMR